MFKVLIIEDEIKAAQELKNLIEQMHENLQVCAILDSVESALNWFGSNEMPQLILSDIQLSDGLSFEIFRKIPVHAPVIFCTAFDQYSLQAFEANGIDYVLKPVEKEKLKRSFEKLRLLRDFFDQDSVEYDNRFKKMLFQLNEINYKNSVLVYAGNKIIPISTDEIYFIHCINNLVYLNTLKQKFEIRETLGLLSAELNPADFYRANRQFIFSRKAVNTIRLVEARKLEVILFIPTPQPVTISKEKASAFLKWLRSK